MGWQMHDAMIRTNAMREVGLTWIEEPFIPEDIESHVRFGKLANIPIAAGEIFIPNTNLTIISKSRRFSLFKRMWFAAAG